MSRINKTLGKQNTHLCVVGEFAGGPLKTTTPDHLARAAEVRARESPGECVGWPEFEWRAKCIADGGANEGTCDS
jgi:hypothetical protein